MTGDRFRALALEFPHTEERSHMDHPDFRVAGKIFATLNHRDGREVGVAMLTPEEQAQLIDAEPEVFEPVGGAWGKRGATWVHLDSTRAKPALVRRALRLAWQGKAPRRLAGSDAWE